MPTFVVALRRFALAAALCAPLVAVAQQPAAPPRGPQWLNADTSKKTNQSNFRALEEWPAPNDVRNATGGPGPRYWQQKVDYTIRVALDTVAHAITGSERITYRNNSPERLSYLWIQLDQDIERNDSRAALSERALPRTIPARARALLAAEPISTGGYTLTRVQLVDASGAKRDAQYFRNGTQMRVELATPIATGQSAVLEIDWSFIVPEAGRNGRGVREKVRDGWLYEIAQWYPRVAVYDDVNGWQNVQFYGQGEFYLEFGDYDVSITVPHDHIVRATGTLANPQQTLTATQRARLATALQSDTAVFIIRADEVGTPATRPAGTAPITWRFTAQNVRDFAFASSKTYVWDAAGFKYRPSGRTIELHSVYPRDAMPLWDKVSTRAIRQTLITYGRMAFEYPYPQASNVHGPVFGMEYPMIAFCGARPRPDGTYDKSLEYALAGVTIHEVGHNWFPMIVASDERRWTWMDEGINSFLEYYASLDYDKDWPRQSLRGPGRNLTNYMRTPNQVPLMTESDAIYTNFGNNGYAKPAAGLVMLREHVLGAETFDRAFREYSQKWMFKHPQPQDFYRSLVSGAGEELNWFWRGWFYTTYANDQTLATVETQSAQELIGSTARGSNYHRITVQQLGGLIMPIQMEVTFEDGSKEMVRLPADVWRNNEKEFSYGFFSNKAIQQVVLDPLEAFVDINRENNTWRAPPPRPLP
jgi:hypothetical protein